MGTPKIGAEAIALVAGIQKHFPNGTQVKLGGVVYALNDLVTLLQSVSSSASTTAALRAQWLSAAKVGKANAIKAGPVMLLLKAYVRAVFGDDPAVLQDFGVATIAARRPTAKVVAQAVDKAQATRTARHTLGKRQKQAIKGTTVSATSAGGIAPKA